MEMVMAPKYTIRTGRGRTAIATVKRASRKDEEYGRLEATHLARRRGRPSLDRSGAPSKVIHVRVSIQHYATVRQAASHMGVTLAEYVRRKLHA